MINGGEIVDLVRTLGHNPTEAELLEILAQVDIDHDGQLDFYEFTLLMNDKLAKEGREDEASMTSALKGGERVPNMEF